jgi:hypothetical protein
MVACKGVEHAKAKEHGTYQHEDYIWRCYAPELGGEGAILARVFSYR